MGCAGFRAELSRVSIGPEARALGVRNALGGDRLIASLGDALVRVGMALDDREIEGCIGTGKKRLVGR